jgi:hypothetical protein
MTHSQEERMSRATQKIQVELALCIWAEEAAECTWQILCKNYPEHEVFEKQKVITKPQFG